MLVAIIILLALCCAALLGYLLVLNRGLRAGRERMAGQMENQTVTRLDIPCPNAAAEALFASLNGLLELRQAERAESLQKERDLRRQIADVSHDLRTPLTSILGYLQLLEDEGLTPSQRAEYLAVVRGRAATLQSLVTSFYDLSRLEGGQWQLRCEPVELVGIVQDQLAAAYETLEEAGLPPAVDIPEDLPAVWADEKAVVRAVSNLLTNALRHGAPPLTLRLSRAGERVTLCVANAAPGMTAEQAARVFERFYTADPSRSGESSGLGLAIVEALMQRMGGTARATLEEGLFTVQLTFQAACGAP